MRRDASPPLEDARYVVSLRDGARRERHELTDVRDPASAAALLADDVAFRVALNAPRVLFVHAAAVAWQGRVIALPGRSCAGKSTLAAALVRAGATYFSDEFAILDETGLVHPFTRPLHLRARDGEPARDVAPEELGGTAASMPLPLGVVVSTTYQVGHAWRPAPMSPGEIALAMLGNTVAARRRPDFAIELIARAIGRGARGVRGARGDAADAAARMLDHASRIFTPCPT